MIYKLPSLPYSYDEFEPYIDAETMEVHHTKHHQTYIDNTNNILKTINTISLPIEELILHLDSISFAQKIVLRNNVGGHANHSFFWKGLKKNTVLTGSLKKCIEKNFTSIKCFKDQFNSTAISLFGSGWIWLVLKNNKLNIVTTTNQDHPLMKNSITNVNLGYPIIGLDLWEHAYYLKYKNRRIDYVESFWNIVNWKEASSIFDKKILEYKLS